MGNWSVEESKMSSTFRELRATSLVLQSFASQLRRKEVLRRTDNKNTEVILTVGSRKADLRNEAVDIYTLCRLVDIRLTVEWISRDFNEEAESYNGLKIVTIICLILHGLLA